MWGTTKQTLGQRIQLDIKTGKESRGKKNMNPVSSRSPFQNAGHDETNVGVKESRLDMVQRPAKPLVLDREEKSSFRLVGEPLPQKPPTEKSQCPKLMPRPHEFLPEPFPPVQNPRIQTFKSVEKGNSDPFFPVAWAKSFRTHALSTDCRDATCSAPFLT